MAYFSHKFFILFFVFFSSLSTVFAQDTTASKPRLLEEVVVLATRSKDSDPFAQTVISKKKIDKQNFGQNIPVILQNTPSVVYTTDDGTGFGASSMRIRGSDATRTNVTINDIPLNDPESQAVFWYNLPNLASSAADIQIQRGAGTSTNGPGAFGGSVNIRTVGPRENAGADLSYSVGSFGSQMYSAEFSSGLVRKHFEFSGRLTNVSSDGYVDRAWSKMSSYYLSGGYFDNKTSIRIIGFGGKQQTYQAWNGIDAETMAINRRANTSGAIYDSNWENVIGYYDNEIDDYAQDHLQLIANRIVGQWTINATAHYTFGRGYYESYKQDAKMSRYGIEPFEYEGQILKTTDVIPQKWLYNHFYGGVLSAKYSSDRVSMVFSSAVNKYDGDHFGRVIWAKYANNIAKDHQFYFNKSIKNDANFFAKADYRITEKFSAYLDLQYRYTDLKMKGTEDKGATLDVSKTYSFFNPKLGVSYDLGVGQRAYISYSRASKEPNRSDFTDSDIEPKPEYMDDVELGYSIQKKDFSVIAGAYFMNYKDQLVPTGELSETGRVIRMNVDKSYRLGVELQAEWKVAKFFWWSVNANFSKNAIVGLKFADGAVRDTKISYSPEFVGANVFSFFPVNRMRLDLVSRYVGEQYMSNSNIKESLLDAYFVSDLGFSYEFAKSRILPAVELKAKINNVFNSMYVSNGAVYGTDAVYFPQAGTNFLLGVTFSL